jgi:hypothetical protein
MKEKPPQNPYPWFAINRITCELLPYAIYAAKRKIFNLAFQPESDVQFLKFGPDGRTKEINTDRLAGSVLADQGIFVACDDDKARLARLQQNPIKLGLNNSTYTALSGDPLMIEIAGSFMFAPEKVTALAKLNETYINGFREWSEVQQARVHTMTACLLLGHWYDHLITKKSLQDETLDLWAHAWIRAGPQKDGTRIYFPDKKLLVATKNRLPPVRAEKADRHWKWERVYSSLGLDGIFGARESGRRKHILEQDFREGVQRVVENSDLRNPQLQRLLLLRILLRRELVPKIPNKFRNMFEWEFRGEPPTEEQLRERRAVIERVHKAREERRRKEAVPN